ncbi:MAG: trypsin-like peptidase domain-containing protein [Coriobacteriia bacterium]|nr:trypsin-like peptidase domain-containing protein [Coriobacteriia bacterium]
MSRKGVTVSGSSSGSQITVKGESTSLSEAVASKALPSVVSITVDVTSQSTDPFSSGTQTTQDSGSGVIIKPDGYIITNNHVISGGTKITVNAGGKNYTAKVVGSDTGTDIAVLKIDATGLPAIQIGTSNDLRVGQYVMAIGCPFGLEKSVSTGVVSGLGRSDLMATQTYVTAYTNLIQTDAAINPGNSGGALVDQNGKLIGINALINSTSGSSAGVGFAIPIDTAIDIANQIMSTGKVVHPFLGVSTQTITSDVAQAYNMPVDQGAYVIEISSGSPAASAGLKQGDIITKINGSTITSSDDVFKTVRAQKIGDTISITYYRDNKEQTTTAKLVSDAANQSQQQQQQQQLQQQQQDSSGSSGGSGSGSGSTTDPHQGFTPQQLQDLLKQYGLGN